MFFRGKNIFQNTIEKWLTVLVVLAAALNFIVRIGLWTTVLLLALDNFGVRITTLLAGLGVGGVAVALSVQNVLGDLCLLVHYSGQILCYRRLHHCGQFPRQR